MLRRLSLKIVIGVVLGASAHGQALDEYRVKAAFVYNFAKFIEWPSRAFHGPSEPIAICVLGQDPFGGALQETVKGKEAAGRQLLVRNISDVRGPGSCQILFVSSSERKHLSSILAGAKRCGLLTVGEMDGFASAGGIINFKLEDGRVRFEINVEAAQQNELRISSKLLSLAESVKK
jgi:uncharacterized protein DUF4154